MPKPFRRYQIQPVWRADKPQRGRFREFYQCDIDIVGTNSLLADVEVITIVYEALKRLGFKKFTIKINHRKILKGLIDCWGVKDKEFDILRAIDKLEKIGVAGVQKELLNKGVTDDICNKVLTLIKDTANSTKVLKEIDHPDIKEGLAQLDELFLYLQKSNVDKNFYKFDISMVRGLDYYTGIIHETLVEEPKIGSIAAGGRYDELIGKFSGTKVPATGVSFGLERLIEVINEFNLLGDVRKTVVDVLVVPLNSLDYVFEIVNFLRKNMIKTELFFERDIRYAVGYAARKNIPFVVIIGEDEEKSRKISLRNMLKREQKLLEKEEAIKEIKTGLNSQNT